MTAPLSPQEPDIIVQGYSDRYSTAVKKLLRVEGGFVDDPKDRGGATKYGISLRFLVAQGKLDLDGDGKADFDLDMDGDLDGQDIRQLRRGDAVFLYHKCFWRPVDAEGMPPRLGEAMFDQAVNGGLAASKKLLQRAINALWAEHRYRSMPLTVDGAIGAKTKVRLDYAVKVHGVRAVVEAYRSAVKDRYLAIVRAYPDQARFLKGWLRRADELGA